MITKKELPRSRLENHFLILGLGEDDPWGLSLMGLCLTIKSLLISPAPAGKWGSTLQWVSIEANVPPLQRVTLL